MTKKKPFTRTRSFLRTASLVMAALLMSAMTAPTVPVYADRFDEQIEALQNEISGFHAQAAELNGRAASLEAAVGTLQAQQNTIAAEIRLNEVKLAQLNEEIAANERKLGLQQETLSSTISGLYVEGQVSPLEVLASSGTLGDYLDQQEYRASITGQVKASVKKIKQLKAELNQQKTDVERVIADQNARNAELDAKKNEQSQLLEQTRGEEAAYQSMINDKNSQVEQLRAEQRAANRRYSGGANVVAGDPGMGGYPAYLYNSPKDSLVDPWGMYNRECVSYAAWKVQQTKGYMPYWGGRGNANEWPSSAQADGIPTGSTPRAQSVAIWMVGYYGHAMWVESVNGGGTITVSQFNYAVDGEYSEMTISAGNIIYIYF